MGRAKGRKAVMLGKYACRLAEKVAHGYGLICLATIATMQQGLCRDFVTKCCDFETGYDCPASRLYDVNFP